MAPGKRTLTEAIDGGARAAGPADEPQAKIEAAASGGGGQPLPGALQHKFGGAFGADLSGVRVHTGGPSAAAAESVNAQAYTTGQDIHFAAGKYDPSSNAGEHLLAHEVVHTVQQRGVDGAAHQAKLEIGDPGDASEREADALATVAVEGRGRATVSERSAPGARLIQRNPGPDASVGSPSPAASSDQAVKPADGTAAAPAAAGPVVRAGIDLTAIGQDQGIRVAVGYYSSATDIAANATKYKSQLLKDVLARGDVKPAGDHPNLKKVVAQVAAGTSNPDANTTASDADLIANGVAGNNIEFGRRATIHATQRKTIGGTAGALVVGTHIAFDEASGKPIEAIQAVSKAIGSLAPTAATATPGATGTPAPNPAGPPAPGATAAPAAPAANIAEVAFFTHGISTNIGLSKDGWMSGGGVAAALGAYATPSVQVLVYGCSAAGGKDSFAETLATALAKAGHKARVFGHTSAGPATVNADGREFTAEPDGAGGAKVHNATDHEMVFTSDFQIAEMPPVAADLGVDLTKGSMYDGWTSNQYTISALIGKVSKTWLAGGLSKVVSAGGLAGANDDGSKSSEEAAYTLGTSKDSTVAALRKEWQAYRSSPAGKAALTKQLPAKGITK